MSIYLTLVFLSFMILAGVLADAACINTGRVHIERSADIATRSVLSEYDQKLKNEYGLFATDLTEQQMEDKLSAYMNRMMHPSLGLEDEPKHVDFYDFKLQKVQVDTEDLSLNNIKLLENQMVEYMRYRAVLGALGEFTKNIEQIEQASNGIVLIEKAAVVYKELEELDHVLNRMRKYSDGWFYDKDKKFNTFSRSVKSLAVAIGQDGQESYIKNLSGLLKSAYKEQLIEDVFSLQELKNKHQDYMDELDEFLYNSCYIRGLSSAEITISRRLSKLVQNENNDDDEEEISQYIQWLEDIEEMKEACYDDLDDGDIYDYAHFYESRIDACIEALDAIDDMITSGRHVQELIDEVNAYIDSMDNKLASVLKDTISEDMATISEMVDFSYGTCLYDAQRIIIQNKTALEAFSHEHISYSIIQELEEDAYIQGRYIDDDFNVSIFVKTLKNYIRQHHRYNNEKKKYNDAWQKLLLAYNSDFTVEPFSASLLEFGIENISESSDIESLEEDYEHQEELYQPIDDVNNRQLNNASIYEHLPTQIYGITPQPIIDTSIVEGLDIAQMSWNNIKNKLYLNEYILLFFKHHIHSDMGSESFFNYEVEYILYGERSEKKNFIRFQTDLFLLRVGMNMIHIYSDPIKRQQVLEASLPFASISPFLAQFLITSAWAAAESKLDLEQLLEGEEVAFMKTKKDWQLSLDAAFSGKKAKSKSVKINIDKERGNKDSKDDSKPFSINMLDYEDYLRLFLLLRKKDETLYRTLDLIQLNMKGRHYRDFETRNYFGGCQVRTESTIKHLFLKFRWMPDYIRNHSLGRKDIHTQVQHYY